MKKLLVLMFVLLTMTSVFAEQSSKDRLDALVQRATSEQAATAEAAGIMGGSASVPILPANASGAAATTTAGTPPITSGNVTGNLPTPTPTAGISNAPMIPQASVNVNNGNADQYEIPKPKPPTLRDQAFKELLNKISPLTPDQIVEMRKQQDRTQRAVSTHPDIPARPVSSTLTIDLSPGVTPPVIRLGTGFVTSLVFVDSTGQSWPISDYSLGNPKNFNIQWDRKTNTLFIQSTTAYSNGNLAIRLATLDTPVMLSLVSGQREVDYRVDLQVRGRGPNAVAPIVGSSLPSAPNPLLLSVLDGVPPPGSIELQVTGGCGRAWLSKGKMIFRTHLTLLSPAWTATVSSLDGTRVYEMSPTPLILATQNGKPIKIGIRGL